VSPVRHVLALPLALPLALLLASVLGCSPALGWAMAAEQLVFGSFRSAENAHGWSVKLARLFDADVIVETVHAEDGAWYRVRSNGLRASARARVAQLAQVNDIGFWIVRGTLERPDTVTSTALAQTSMMPGSSTAAARQAEPSGAGGTEARPARTGSTGSPADAQRSAGYTDLDLGLQARRYPREGLDGQSRSQPSVSARLAWQRSWDDDQQSVRFSPFVRIDGADSERSHFDIRELFWTRVASDWELHLGVRQVFWGVTEFKHLVDIVNQTDLVEDIDGEEKLGQPMAHLSLVRDWGILDLFLLTGFRERTFPGPDGRLRGAVPIDTDRARYESAAGRRRIDAAIRWSKDWGPLSYGIHHFSGTSRDPMFRPALDPVRGLSLIPEYPVIDQTGIDGQLNAGDWAFKLEAMRRSGYGDAYHAANAGFERTLVGVLGTRADLGLVVEYLYDQRGDDAFDTLFERDVALGARWTFNDLADTQALAGFIIDRRTHERVFSLEASRRFGTAWTLGLEGRLFSGADAIGTDLPPETLLQPGARSAALARDDYFQFEVTRFF